jgi:hypothetical protein
MASRVREDSRSVQNATTLRIICTEVEPSYACQRNRGRAHRTRLERDIKITFYQPLRANRCASAANRKHLGVRRWIALLACTVAGAGEDTAIAASDNGPDRHLATFHRSPRLIKRELHVALKRRR